MWNMTADGTYKVYKVIKLYVGTEIWEILVVEMDHLTCLVLLEEQKPLTPNDVCLTCILISNKTKP